MISIIEKNENNKSLISIEKLLQNVCSLSEWEKVKDFSISEHEFFFADKIRDISLYRKFSAKNNVEKYLLKDSSDNILAAMDMKIYKDSVYIISLNAELNKSYDKLILLLLRVAVETSLYKTSEGEVYINLSNNFFKNYRLRKIISANDFSADEKQSSYEKRLFGVSFKLKISNSNLWYNRIKQKQMLFRTNA